MSLILQHADFELHAVHIVGFDVSGGGRAAGHQIGGQGFVLDVGSPGVEDLSQIALGLIVGGDAVFDVEV
ncbi:MAG: hypothetical protein PVG32_10825, partial [Anaerolineales bacterium]